MDTRLVIAAVLVVIAAAAAWWLERRAPEPPTGSRAHAPAQLDRSDFPRPDVPWLVVLFSSRTCDSCAAMAEKVTVLDSDVVATCEVEYAEERALHDRYHIDAVPLVVVADGDGVVRRVFFGSTTATDLWAALADLRGA